MRDLNYDFKQLCRHNRDGSYATQADREHILDLIADQLHEMGFRDCVPRALSPSTSRTWSPAGSPRNSPRGPSRTGCGAALGGTEDRQGEHRRPYQRRLRHSRSRLRHATYPKPRSSPWISSNTSAPLCIRISLRLQAAFGLRREESIKIVPTWADRGDSLVLKDSWTKGGREREIPVRTLEQRQLLDEAKALAKGKSLVAPGYTTYRDYLQHFRAECARVGIHAFHGHRHFYAQERYRELTGWECAARGGPTSKQLTAKQKAIDREAREVDQPRDGSRPRGHYGRLSWTLTPRANFNRELGASRLISG